MGTHPIFESDFDCLTENQMDNDEVVDEGQDIAWWLKWLTRGVGAVGGITAAIGGALVLVFHILSPLCYGSAACMIILAFLMLCLEAPFCCAKISAAQPIISRLEKVKFWMKGVLYCGLSVISFALCMDSWSMTIGTLILPFACGVLYGLMSLGKKADSATMAAAASGGGNNYRQFDNET